MSFSTLPASSQKTVVVLKEPGDWDEWILIVESMAKRGGIEQYVDLAKPEPDEPIRPITPTFSSMKAGAVSSEDLTEGQRRDLILRREDHREDLRTYREKTEALKNLEAYILTTVDRTNFLYLRGQDSI